MRLLRSSSRRDSGYGVRQKTAFGLDSSVLTLGWSHGANGVLRRKVPGPLG